MTKETTKKTTRKRKQLSKGARQKRKLLIAGGLAIVLLIFIVLLAVFVFGSCGIDYEKADMIREELLSKGIEIKDTREGTTYSLK